VVSRFTDIDLIIELIFKDSNNIGEY